MTRTPVHLALLLVTALALAACQSSETPEEPSPPDVAEEPADAPMEELPPMVADWTGPFLIDLPNGWTVTHCDGEATMLCFADGDRHVGVVELGQYPVDAGAAGADLDAQVAEFITSMREDRAVGCPDRTFEEIPAIRFDVGGVPGVRLGFRMVDADLREVERHVLYWAEQDGTRYWINAAAYGDDGCAERLGEFTPEDLGLVHLYVDAIVEQTPLPAPTGGPVEGLGLPDGEHVVRVVRIDAPVRVVDVERVELLSGQEAIDAARQDGVIGPDEDVPNDVYLRDGDGTVYSAGLEDAVVEVFHCPTTCERVDVPLADYLSGARPAMNGEFAIFEMTVTNGRVEALREIYLP